MSVRSSPLSAMGELFSILLHNKSQRTLNLYGTIKIVDSTITQTIFERQRHDPLCLPSECEGFALSTAALEAIHVGRYFVFKVDLKHRNDDAAITNDAFPDEDVCWGDIIGEWLYESEMPFDKLLSDRVDSKECAVEFFYALFMRAATARVTVKLVPCGGGGGRRSSAPVKVHGRITCGNTSFGDASREIFLKKPKEGVDIQGGCSEPVQLCTTLVVAGLNSKLVICADLWDCSRNKVARRIASDAAHFHVKFQGSSTKVISGRDFDIRVEVFWRYPQMSSFP